MSRFATRASKKAGLPPGTLVHVGEESAREVRITVMAYDETSFCEEQVDTIDACFPLADRPSVTWINVDGIHEVEILEGLGNRLAVHPLVLEDILNTGQRPKLEDFDKYVFVVLKMFRYSEQGDGMEVEQISLILGPSFVISFQEKPGDVFDPIRERIRKSKGHIRRMGADHLAYALIDAIVDNYFVVLERVGEKVEFLEEELVADPRPETLQTIHNLKRDMIFLRKSVWPLRKVVGGLVRGRTFADWRVDHRVPERRLRPYHSSDRHH